MNYANEVLASSTAQLHSSRGVEFTVLSRVTIVCVHAGRGKGEGGTQGVLKEELRDRSDKARGVKERGR